MPPPISIRPYKPGDAAACYEAVMESIDVLNPFMPWAHPGLTRRDQERWVADKIAAFQDRREFEFVMETADGRYAGGCGLNQLDKINRRANLGYWVRSSFQGQGVAPAAARLLVEWGFRNTDLQRFDVIVSAKNPRSLRAAEKAGAVREGLLRSRLLLHGAWHDAVIFSIVRPSHASSPVP